MTEQEKPTSSTNGSTPPETQYPGQGIAATIMWTELHQAFIQDGLDVTLGKCGPKARAWFVEQARIVLSGSLDPAPAAPEPLQFPTMLRKMWSGTEVQEWLDNESAQHFARSSPLDAVERQELEHLRELVGSPEIHDFARGVVLEASHQRKRWGSEHDQGKNPEDWFWLLGYLGGKAVHAQRTGDIDKAAHHAISTAAVLANWHASFFGPTEMRPGIAEDGFTAGAIES